MEGLLQLLEGGVLFRVPLQWCMTQDTLETILHYPRPATVQQMLAFLGLCNYSRQYVPEFTERTTALRQMVTTAGT